MSDGPEFSAGDRRSFNQSSVLGQCVLKAVISVTDRFRLHELESIYRNHNVLITGRTAAAAAGVCVCVCVCVCGYFHFHIRLAADRSDIYYLMNKGADMM